MGNFNPGISLDSLNANTRDMINDMAERTNSDPETVLRAMEDMVNNGECKEKTFEKCVAGVWISVASVKGWPSRVSPDKSYAGGVKAGSKSPKLMPPSPAAGSSTKSATKSATKSSALPKYNVPRQYGVCNFHPTIFRQHTISREGIEWSEQPEYAINISDKASFLGAGSFGDVYIGTNSRGEKAAVKMISKEKMAARKLNYREVYKEIRIQTHLSHPHILQILDVYEDPRAIYIATDIMQGGELLTLVKARNESGISLTESDVRALIKQLFEAMIYCHSQNIVHRDIKLENVLMEMIASGRGSGRGLKSVCLKVADFGFATKCTPTQLLEDFPGSILYAAPEVLRGIPYNGQKSDVWSLGVLFYILATTGGLPFGANLEYHTYVRHQRMMPFRTDDHFLKLSDGLREILHNMLSYDPNGRLSLAALFKRQWFRK